MTDDELRQTLAHRLDAVEQRIREACARAGRDRAEITLVAVTKTVSPRVALAMRNLGVRDLGESRPQELWKKADAVPNTRWHLLGHLQRNKIDRTVPLLTRIHSVDSERLLQSLDAFGRSRGAPVPVFLEVNCSREEAKGGFAPEAMSAIGEKVRLMSGLEAAGLMTMAAHHDDPEQARPTFAELRALRDRLAADTGLSLPHLSMGMSNDFSIAVEEGATIIRIGSTLFEGLEEE